jgi:hypothetical protein
MNEIWIHYIITHDGIQQIIRVCHALKDIINKSAFSPSSWIQNTDDLYILKPYKNTKNKYCDEYIERFNVE